MLSDSIENNATSYEITSIGYYAFGSCQDLESISIPNTVKNIEKYAFAYCTSLVTVKLPETITEANVFDVLKKWIYNILNFPVLLIWNQFIQSKIKEVAFLSTFRFAYAVLVYPIYYGLIIGISYLFNLDLITGILISLMVFIYNLFYTKTS